MSYDLYLKPRQGLLSRERFLAHFESDPLFTVEGDEVVYQNEATGTYFLFSWRALEPQPDGSGADADDEAAPDCPIWFNLNFFRPSTFGLEAAPHLTRLVRELDLVVIDPQSDGMGEGDYSVDGFLSGWNAGNTWAIGRILEEHRDDEQFGLLPQAALHRAWAWNLAKGRREAALAVRGIDRFIPTQMYARVGDRVGTLIVWPDGIPFECSPTDFILVIRDELARRQFLRRTPDQVLIRWAQIESLFDRHGRRDNGVPAFTYKRPPAEVLAFVKGLPRGEPQMQLIAPDRVLDAEFASADACELS